MAQRVVAGLACAAAFACASASPLEDEIIAPTAPIPTTALAGQPVTVYPLTMLTAEVALGWDSLLTPRSEALATADSLLEWALTERNPEVDWILPRVLRRASARAPGLVPNPDRMGTALLRNRFREIPDPLRSEMRVLTGTAGDRFALVPASLVFFAEESGGGRAELAVSLVDVRTGHVPWMTVARASAADPWTALRMALELLTPVVQ